VSLCAFRLDGIPDRECDPENTSHRHIVIEAHGGGYDLCHFVTDVQTKTGVEDIGGFALLDIPHKDALSHVLRDTWARVCDANGAGGVCAGEMDVNMATVRELDGIANEIGNDASHILNVKLCGNGATGKQFDADVLPLTLVNEHVQ
jgi:hypothetical protein